MLYALNEYIKSMVVVSIIVSFIMTIAPKGSMKSILGVVSGLLIIITLVRPITGLANIDFRWPDISSPEIGTDTSGILEDQDKLLKELIVEKTSAYILAKAQALDVDCEVIVTLDDSSPPLPNTAIIKANILYNPGFLREMSEFLAFDCGISKENQSFYWREK